MQMTRNDTVLVVITGGFTAKFKDLGSCRMCWIHNGQVNLPAPVPTWLLPETADSIDKELETTFG